MYTNEEKNCYVKVYPNKDAIRQMRLKSIKDNNDTCLDLQFHESHPSDGIINVAQQRISNFEYTEFLMLLLIIFNDYNSDSFFYLLLMSVLL